MADPIEKLAEVVPSIYYDVIARIIPGVFTAAAYLWTRSCPLSKLTEATGLKGASMTIVALMVSYVLGMFLTPIGSGLCEGPILLLSKISRKPWLSGMSSRQLWKRIAEIEALAPAAAATLAKMSAEVILFQNLLAGVVLVWFISGALFPWTIGCATLMLCAANVGFRTHVLFRRVGEFELTCRTKRDRSGRTNTVSKP